jgi:hypothetical protein
MEGTPMKKSSWKQADVFPVIASVIEELYENSRRPVTADQIAAGLLTRAEGYSLVNAARGVQVKPRTHDWLAGNMVAWFSQRITMGQSEWAAAFERRKIKGRWAYWPLANRQRQ